jgi:hypothetical protein
MEKYNGKLILATFFYKHQACTEYTASVVATAIILNKLNIKFDYCPINGNFHMEVVVNSLLASFLNDDDEATDLIMIDSDESWKPEHLVRLLLHDKEIVSGAYLKCQDKKEYAVDLKTAEDGSYLGKVTPDGNCLLEAKRIAAGFLKISKTALQKWVKAFPDNWYWMDGKKCYSFFYNKIENNCFTGMDYCFADSMKAAGVQLWVDPVCDIQHWNITSFKGTLDEHLRNLKAEQNV